MYTKLKRFSSAEELAPVFNHGGALRFRNIIQATCITDGNAPWEIFLRIWPELAVQKEELVHEFVHLFHDSHWAFAYRPNHSEVFFNESATQRATKALMKRDPMLADAITRELLLHPRCSIAFESDEARAAPFWTYCRGFVAEFVQKIKEGTFEPSEIQRSRVASLARMFDI